MVAALPGCPDAIVRQLPPGFAPARIDVDDGQHVHALTWGPAASRDAPTLVLVHGNPTWGFLWRKVVAALRAAPGGARLRIVVPDLVGLGLSSKPPLAAHSLPAHGRWLGAALARLAPGPVVLAAQDWGGPIGLLAVADRLADVRGLVLGNTAVSPPHPGFRPTLFHRLSQVPGASELLFRGLGFPLWALHRVQGDPASIRGEVARAYRWPLRQRAARAAPLALARLVPDHPTDHPSVPSLARTHALFASLQAPIALVWGERDPILGRVVNHLARTRPDATVVRTRAGHFLQEEVPDELARAIQGVMAWPR